MRTEFPFARLPKQNNRVLRRCLPTPTGRLPTAASPAPPPHRVNNKLLCPTMMRVVPPSSRRLLRAFSSGTVEVDW